MTTKQKYNESICPLMESRSGNLSWRVTQDVFDQLQKVGIGGRLLVRFLSDSQRKNGSKSPKAYLDFMTADEVAKFESENNNNYARADQI